MPVTGSGLALASAGGIILFSGIKGSSLSATVRALLAGSSSVANTEPIASATSTAGEVTAADGSGNYATPPAASTASETQNQAIGKLYASVYGWATGAQWTALVELWDRESGWNNYATNPTSGAFGIAQALGHGGAGYAGTYSDNYPNTAANSGDPGAQIAWGLQYIQQTYGNPVNALAHENSAGWY
jgi:hypothetical protein